MSTHLYISTYCQHGQHEDCRLVCKVCDSPCLCPCHRDDGGAEALRDAADALGALVDAQHPAAANPDQWLLDRAALLDGGDQS